MKSILKKIVLFIITTEARLVLWKYKPQIIAVTGSVGKTGTKDAIYTAVSSAVFARKSNKSFNSEIGVPLTILGCDTGWSSPVHWLKNILEGLALILFKNHYPKWLVLEVGADSPGDIVSLTRWLKPNVVVITALPSIPVHVENFRSPEDVIREKRALAEALVKGGTLVLCGDDEKVLELKNDFRGLSVTYGTQEHNDFVASHPEVVYGKDDTPGGMQFRIDYTGSSVPIDIHDAVGVQQIYPALAALAVGNALGLDMVSTARTLSSHRSPNGRMRIIAGVNGATIIDDSYNSSPTALSAALDTLATLKTNGRKIAVLGDMLELGKYSTEAHKAAGVAAANVADILITVGIRARDIAGGAREAKMAKSKILVYESREAQKAGKELREKLKPADIVLLKGSQGSGVNTIRLERAVKEIMRDRSRAAELLVRQERQWKESEGWMRTAQEGGE